MIEMKKSEVLANAACDIVGELDDFLTERSKAELTRVMKKEVEDIDSFDAHLVCKDGVEPSMFNGDCTLNVRAAYIDNVTDEGTGDCYSQYKLDFRLSWSSQYGDVTPRLGEKVRLMMKAVEEASVLAVKYGGTYKTLRWTAAQVEERKNAAEQAKVLSKVKLLAQYAVKGMRVNGNRREVPKAMFAGIPDGDYKISYINNNYVEKKYTVTLLLGAAFLSRTA